MTFYLLLCFTDHKYEDVSTIVTSYNGTMNGPYLYSMIDKDSENNLMAHNQLHSVIAGLGQEKWTK